MLVQRRNTDIRVYFVWGRFAGLDDEERSRQAAKKHAAPGAVHFWMPAPVLREDLTEVLKISGGRAIFDVYLLYRKRVFWEAKLPTPTSWQQQMGVLQGEPFNITRLEAQIQRLLTQ